MAISQVNPNILLSARQFQPDIAFRQGQENRLFRESQQAQIGAREQQTAVATEEAAFTAQQRAQREQNLKEFSSIVEGVRQLGPLIPTDDDPTGEQASRFSLALEERSRDIVARDGNPADTDQIRQLLQQGNLPEIRRQFADVMQLESELRRQGLGLEQPTRAGAQPASIQEFNLLKRLQTEGREEDIQLFMDAKRQNQKFVTINNGRELVNLFTGERTILSTPATETEAAATEASAIARAQTKARNEEQIAQLPRIAQAQAKLDLPNIEAVTDQSITLIDDILDDPGLPAVIGFFQGRARGLTGKQRGLVKKIEQVQGKVFLSAFGELKGGGQITELEGKTATDAHARINDRTVDIGSFRESMFDLRGVMVDSRGRARTLAGISQTEEAETPTEEIDRLRRELGF